MRFIFLFFIRVYQFTISPLIGKCCRFYPSCSDYGFEAIRKHGIFKGGWMLTKRLLKCGPWHPGGVDEVKE